MNPSNKPLVSVITVNYNSIDATLELLKSLDQSSYSNTEVIVIDNGSLHDPHAIIHQAFPSIAYKRSVENLGFAGGNNLGIELAKGDFLFFINNDTEVTPALIENLVNIFSENPSIGTLSPKIKYYGTNIIQYAGYTSMSKITVRNRAIGSRQEDGSRYAGLYATPYAHGAAMMVRREVIARVGPMPTVFFLYYEELDWCEQIRKSGFSIAVDRSSVIYHKESMSVGKANPLKLFYQTRNRILFARRNMSYPSKILFHLYFYMMVSPVKLLQYSLKQEWVFFGAYASALLMRKQFKG
jgi:GT2 family glycosyltransferase